MIKKKLLLMFSILLFLISLVGCSHESNDWRSQVVSLTVYNASDWDFDAPWRSYIVTSYRTVDQKAQTLIPKTTFTREKTLWKGRKIGVVRLKDGSEIRIAISYYGSFFSKQGEEGYYYFKEEKYKNEWDQLIDEGNYEKKN